MDLTKLYHSFKLRHIFAGETEENAKKPVMKIKLGSIKISETSAALIQSGLKFDTKKQALLEEG